MTAIPSPPACLLNQSWARFTSALFPFFCSILGTENVKNNGRAGSVTFWALTALTDPIDYNVRRDSVLVSII